MAEEPYQVKLDDIFEGPMDLLVHLIKKNEVDIYDIPIALITDQYLEYLEWMKAMSIDLAGDFLLMAATLAHIKSRMLLPAHEEEEEEEDPRLEITRPLLEYLQIKSAAELLGARPLLGDGTFTRKSDKKTLLPDRNEETIQVGLFELIDAFQTILDNLAPDHRVDLSADHISVKERITEIADMLEVRGSVTFDDLFPTRDTSKSDIVVTFLAILEMVKLGLLRISQHLQTGIIRLFYL